ncbi:MAG TPA: SWIM zinc finger family protein, partial [Streptosporangiaceae bacterium]|nr:SWIM zinc finger family protein [Streptosporangiaceae bacterium]
PLARFATGPRVYGLADPGGQPVGSAWELTCDGARFVVVLSPEVNRGFSGEGAVLADLADNLGEEDADHIAALPAWDPRIDLARLSADGREHLHRSREKTQVLGLDGLERRTDPGVISYPAHEASD